MTSRERLIKNFLFFSILIYYLGGYFLINLMTVGRKDLHHLALPFENSLPFAPALIFAYVLEFVLLGLTYLMVDDLPYFKKIVRAFTLCVTLHFVVFLVFPVEYNLRPVINPEQGWAYQFVSFYYWLDLPYNCFPSMHVSNAFLVAFLLQRFRPGLGWVLHPISVLIAISVVLVKQHYIADVVAGFFVGWLVDRFVFRGVFKGR